jgi:hypothetical protein
MQNQVVPSQTQRQRWRSIWLIAGTFRLSGLFRLLRLPWRRSAILSPPSPTTYALEPNLFPASMHPAGPRIPRQPSPLVLNFPNAPPSRLWGSSTLNRVTGSRFCYATGCSDRVTASKFLTFSWAGRGHCLAQGKKATHTTTHPGGTSYRESDVERGIA